MIRKIYSYASEIIASFGSTHRLVSSNRGTRLVFHGSPDNLRSPKQTTRKGSSLSHDHRLIAITTQWKHRRLQDNRRQGRKIYRKCPYFFHPHDKRQHQHPCYSLEKMFHHDHFLIFFLFNIEVTLFFENHFYFSSGFTK